MRSGSARRSWSCPRSTVTFPDPCRFATRGSPSTRTRHGAVSRRLYETLAAIHGIDWRAAGLDSGIPARDLDGELDYWTRYLDWYGERRGARSGAERSAQRGASRIVPPHEPPPAFLWGDVRLGNIIFDETRRPVAVLDWEMTTIGAPEHDLAWQLTLEATQNELFGRVGAGLSRP